MIKWGLQTIAKWQGLIDRFPWLVIFELPQKLQDQPKTSRLKSGHQVVLQEVGCNLQVATIRLKLELSFAQ